ncbi:hypothetical protein PtB15_9B289 [Puccinia triticina]|nr:hypothetical protein PtB15_9B289 [Puccinia triticina]
MSFMDDPGGHYPLDRKLAQLRADFGEDIAVYDYTDDGLVESTAGLEEDMNDFNDETFGMDTVDKDFDFSGSTAQYLGALEPPKQKSQDGANWTTMSSLLADREPSGSLAPRSSSPSRRKAGPVSLLEDPLLAPKSNINHRHSSGPFPASKPPGSAPAATVSKPHKIRTLEEIEAELRANSAAKNSIPPAGLPPQALTLEQVEAALLANHERKLATTTASRSSTPHAALPFSQPSLQSRAQSVQQIHRNINAQPLISSPVMAPMPRGPQTPSSLPPHNHPAHPAHPQHSEWLPVPSPPQVLPGRHVSNPPVAGFGHHMRTGSVPPRSATQTPFVQTPSGTIPVEELRSAAEARIQEQERREALRRRKATKIAEMSKYNNLMSQGDKDFITRIQVSQLVNPSHGQAGFDPYADDFYFHVYSAIRASRVAAQHQAHTAVAGRRAQAASSDERISQDYDGIGGLEPVRNSRAVERRLTRLSLEGALGKISLRTRSAPRQMLQVQPTSSDDLTTAAGGENHPGALAGSLPNTTPIGAGQPAMRHRQILMSLERLYSTVLEVEQLRRTQPSAQSLEMEDGKSQLDEWEAQYESQKDKIWKQLRVLDPLGISHPHPFVSLISVPKGKRVLPRVMRLLNREQSLQVLTLLVATFETVDVVSDARMLDLPSDSSFSSDQRSRPEIELETELFMNCVVAPMMAVINEISLDLVTGLVSLLMARNDLMQIARSKAGIAFLTLFLSRAELLRSVPSLESNEQNEPTTPSHESISRWQGVFNQLFHYLSSDFPSLFPSTRLAGALSLGAGLPPQLATDSLEMNQKYMRSGIDLEDEPVWQLMAALAVSTDSDGQQILVGGLRGKVLENVIAVNKKSVSDEIGSLKIRNVNLMLHALGLDASMIKL